MNVPGAVRQIAKVLIKIFNSNKRWTARDMNIHEAANVSVAVASLKLETEKFIADLADIVKANIKDATNNDMINLAKTSFYMRKF